MSFVRFAFIVILASISLGSSGSAQVASLPDTASFSLDTSGCPDVSHSLLAVDAPTYDCSGILNGARFNLETDAGEIVKPGVIDQLGVVTFSDLEAGAYRISGDAPVGLSTAFILDCRSNIRTLASVVFYPMAINDSQISFEVEVLAGEQMSCDWFGIPAS